MSLTVVDKSRDKSACYFIGIFDQERCKPPYNFVIMVYGMVKVIQVRQKSRTHFAQKKKGKKPIKKLTQMRLRVQIHCFGERCMTFAAPY